ncbi:MAG TPA: hypothetical protein DCW60_04565, partial [Sutterella sp.]|nr:hypothetical protein [Sutterella sp.]
MTRKIVSAVALALLSCGYSVAWAAYFGNLEVTSAPEENFAALVEVKDVNAQTKSLLAKLAPEATYERYNLPVPSAVQGMTLTLASRNPLRLRISGRAPAAERQFALLMELHQDGEVSVRQYNVLADSKAAVAPRIPTLAKAGESASSTAQPTPAVTPAVTSAPQAKSETPAVVQSATPQTSPVTSATPQTSSATASSTSQSPLAQMRAQNYDLTKPVRVEPGYTPWSLGVLYHDLYPQASVHQVLTALAIHNPEAFPKDNVLVLKTGATVTAPPKALVEGINRDKAVEAVQKGTSVSALKPKAAAPAKPVTQAKPVSQAKPMPQAKPAPQPKPATVAATTETPPPPPAKPVVEEDVPRVAPPPPAPEPEPAAVTQEKKPASVMQFDVEPEEESSSLAWLWWILGGGIVLCAGAIGYFFWRGRGNPKFARVKDALQGADDGQRKEPAYEPVQTAEPYEPELH